MTNKCECGGRMVARRENYLFEEECGLPVTLADVEVRRCDKCGERGVVIQNPGAIKGAIAGVLARKRGRLAGAEITFLREVLGRNGREFARLLQATPVSVSRWEQEAGIPGPHPDKLMRTAAVIHVRDFEYSVLDLEAAASEDWNEGLRFTLERTKEGGWQLQGEAETIRPVRGARRA